MKVNKPVTLDFAEYIKKLPPQWVIEHFLEEFDASRKILSSSMIEDAVKKFSSAEVLIQRFLQLPSATQLRCALVYLSGDHGITLVVSNAFDDPLILSFFAYAATGSDGSVRIFGFDQFEKHLHHELVKVLLSAATVEHVPLPPETFAWRVLNNVTTVAALCMQGIISKKRYGGISKTASNQLKKLVDTGISKTDGNEFVFSLAIGYLQHKKILTETESQYSLIIPAFTMWLSDDPTAHLNEIESFCFKYAGGWRRELFLDLINENNNNWISSRMFPEQDQKNAINTLFALRFCGLIELQLNDDDIIFTKSRQAEKQIQDQEKDIVVLPDFSAIIPQEINPIKLFHFTQLGTLQSLDRVYWGKVDKQVLLDSCARGVDSTQILEWLSGWQAPVNVLETVREWLREFLRLFITDQNVLVSSDEKVTMQINSYDPIRLYLEPVTAHAVFKIKKGNELKVKEILQNLGFDYRMPGKDEQIESEQETSEEISINWVPVTEIEKPAAETIVPMRGTKYGSELKVLDTSEIVHVIDYAILTGGAVSFDYEGSPYLKQGIYTVKPLSFQKGIEPTFEGEITRTKSKKMFYLKKIRKIGVVQR